MFSGQDFPGKRLEMDIANKNIALPALSSTIDKRKPKKGILLGNTFPRSRWGRQERVA